MPRHRGVQQLDDIPAEIDGSYPTCALRAEVDEDNWCWDIIIYFKGRSLSDLSTAERRKTQTKAHKYVLKRGKLYHINPLNELKPCISQTEVLFVMIEFHDSTFGGHWGAEVTLLGLRQIFYWPTIIRDVMSHVRACDHCQQFRRDYQTNELRPTWVVESFDLLYINWITKLPTTTIGKITIIVCTDALTKWTDAKAYPSATLLVNSQFLSEHFVFQLGIPMTMATGLILQGIFRNF